MSQFGVWFPSAALTDQIGDPDRVSSRVCRLVVIEPSNRQGVAACGVVEYQTFDVVQPPDDLEPAYVIHSIIIVQVDEKTTEKT